MNPRRFLLLLLLVLPSVLRPQQLNSDSLFLQALQRDLGTSFTTDGTCVLLHTGADKFRAMFQAIRQARHYVHLEYFNFRNDSIGLALFDLLGQKAAEGVQVRALYDSFGNSSNDSPLEDRHLQAIRATGVQVEEYDPIRFPWLNHAFHRDHRKIVVIDGVVCYTGGMNVADYYISGRPEYGEWRDMHMELTGDVVTTYERLFARMWWQQTGQVLLDEDYAPQTTAAAFTLQPDTTPTAGQKVIGVVERRPGRHSADLRRAYVAAIDAARHHIEIVNPYPTNVRSVRRALRRALRRGVEVEIMVSAKSDVPVTPDIVALEMKKLARRGATVYYNQTGFHHSKVMTVDGCFCTVGSTNLDARSFCFDYEVNSFIMDPHTTHQLSQLFEQDKQNCTLFRAQDYRRQFNFGHRLTGHLFSLLRPFF